MSEIGIYTNCYLFCFFTRPFILHRTRLHDPPDIFMPPRGQLLLGAQQAVLQTLPLATHGHGQHRHHISTEMLETQKQQKA